jgi:hypothetical protein
VIEAGRRQSLTTAIQPDSSDQHFLKRPFASRHGAFFTVADLAIGAAFGAMVVAAGAAAVAAGGHLINLPFGPLHGAAKADAGMATTAAPKSASTSFLFM